MRNGCSAGTVRRALKTHMLQKVRDAVLFFFFVMRAGFNKHEDRDRRVSLHRRGNDPQAVFEHRAFCFHLTHTTASQALRQIVLRFQNP